MKFSQVGKLLGTRRVYDATVIYSEWKFNSKFRVTFMKLLSIACSFTCLLNCYILRIIQVARYESSILWSGILNEFVYSVICVGYLKSSLSCCLHRRVWFRYIWLFIFRLFEWGKLFWKNWPEFDNYLVIFSEYLHINTKVVDFLISWNFHYIWS